MAFRQQHPPPLRQLSFSVPHQPAEAAAPQPESPRTKRIEEEWILFSPSQDGTHTTSTERTPRTAGLSRLSDFGSLETAARSDQQDDDDDITCQGSDIEEEGELDSLDDGLHAFHEPSEHGSPVRRLDTSGGTVLPTHDGLGTFPTSSAMVQEQLWQFEQYNPKRKARRRSSVQKRLDALEEAEELHHESDRTQRIEKWRLDQSRALLEEIERETRRRRRMSRVSAARSRAGSIIPSDVPSVSPAKRPAEDSAATTTTNEPSDNESWWTRFTRRVIRDLMGIDENLLSVIFGEELPAEAQTPPSEEAAQKEMERILTNPDGPSVPGEPWQHRLLERIARELGVLVHQLSEHPGAFSTYLRTQEIPSYAGIAATPRRLSLGPATPTTPQTETAPATSSLFPPHQTTTYSEASLWGIEEEPEAAPYDPGNLPSQPSQQEREYWERELDVKMVFNFLKDRFSSRPSSPSPEASGVQRTFTANPANPQDILVQTTPTTAGSSTNPLDSARRAALIRQHHPLVNRGAEPGAARRLHRHHQHQLMRRSIGAKTQTASSSCASQSTKKSKRSGSSRNYWDLGGSVGSGPAGSGGVWGEV